MLSYVAEYASFIIVLAYMSTKLILTFSLSSIAYAIIGSVAGIYLVISGLIAIPIGHYTDRYGRRKFTIIGCVLGALALFSLPLIDRFSTLNTFLLGMFISLALLGTAHGTYTASTLAYTGDIAKENVYGKPYGLVEGAEFVGYAFGPAMGVAISLVFGRFFTFAISGIILVLSAIIAYAFMKEDKPGRYVPNVSENPNGNPTPANLHTHAASWSDFFAAFKIPIVGIILITTLIASIAFSGFFYYVPVFADSLRQKIPILGVIYPIFQSLVAGVGVIMMIPFGHLEDRYSRRMPYLASGLLIGSLALAEVFIFPSAVGFMVASIVFGLSLAMTRVSQLVILAEHSTLHNRAGIMGTNHAVEHAGYGIGSVIGGVVVSLLGFVATFKDLSIFLVISGFLVFAFSFLRHVK
jgi:MFS family permease